MLRVANKRRLELRNSLRKKLSVATLQQKKLRGDRTIETLDELVFYGPQLKRALLGGIPKSEGVEFDEPDKKSGSSRSKGPSLSVADRAMSSSSRARR